TNPPTRSIVGGTTITDRCAVWANVSRTCHVVTVLGILIRSSLHPSPSRSGTCDLLQVSMTGIRVERITDGHEDLCPQVVARDQVKHLAIVPRHDGRQS